MGARGAPRGACLEEGRRSGPEHYYYCSSHNLRRRRPEMLRMRIASVTSSVFAKRDIFVSLTPIDSNERE